MNYKTYTEMIIDQKQRVNEIYKRIVEKKFKELNDELSSMYRDNDYKIEKQEYCDELQFEDMNNYGEALWILMSDIEELIEESRTGRIV